ncbi:acyltransferase [uncultured Desulfuromonas sp.]|uniref:acyltransferase family protein n=1 Tax=uncultured Desulfuromonas sp. TaxID=181013 RepID=UPI002AAC0F3C|nr:acyltransferase [uncultured Desulfuromonas sp.]
MANGRDLSLDFMRVMGVLIIMLAHSDPPKWLFQLRNFGTPLLIVASALTYSTIYKERKINIIPFLIRRVTKITIPSWVFLTIFFLIFLVSYSSLDEEYPFTNYQIVTSYLFWSGIGYVWILKIYLTIAFIIPIFDRIDKSTISNRMYFSSIIILYIFYEFVYFSCAEFLYSVPFLKGSLFTIFPYVLVFAYGYRLNNFDNWLVFKITLYAAFAFCSIAILAYIFEGKFFQTQYFKYPPRVYYLSYALMCTNIMFLLSRSRIMVIFPKNILIWFSSNSLWIYLWHILGIYILRIFNYGGGRDFFTSLYVAIFILSFGTILTFIQGKVVYFVSGSRDTALCRLMSYVFTN